MNERLQKVLARAGVCSRRAAEQLIVAGRVRVNGHLVSELGTKVDSRNDRVEVDGKRLVREEAMYLVLHKPRGVVSTMNDPEGRPSVAELVKGARRRVFPIGRLDFHTSGVLLFSNDGDFSAALLHPKKGVPKTYVLKVAGLMQERDVERWRTGVELDDGPTRPAEVKCLRHEEGKTWVEITLHEGRNQQIRRMGEATGFPVMRLARVSFAGMTAEHLRPGQWRELTTEELLELREQFGAPRRVRKQTGTPVASPTPSPSPRSARAVRTPRAPRSPRAATPTAATTQRSESTGSRRSRGSRESVPPRSRTADSHQRGQGTSPPLRDPSLTRRPPTRTRKSGG